MRLTEVFRMALSALRTNKLRSILTMLGVTIGVFSVIGVMTALSVIQSSIENGLSFLGSNIFQFAKYPVINKRDPEEKYRNRRNIGLTEAMEYKKAMAGETSAVCLKAFDYSGKPASYENKKVQGLPVVGTDEAFLTANSYTLGYGRNLQPDDVEFARSGVEIGARTEKLPRLHI